MHCLLGLVFTPFATMERGHVVRGIYKINIALVEKVGLTKVSLLEVFLHARLNILFVDGDEVVPVWPHVLMDESQRVKHLVSRCHQAVVEAISVTHKNIHSAHNSPAGFVPIQCNDLFSSCFAQFAAAFQLVTKEHVVNSR